MARCVCALPRGSRPDYRRINGARGLLISTLRRVAKVALHTPGVLWRMLGLFARLPVRRSLGGRDRRILAALCTGNDGGWEDETHVAHRIH